jgi:peptidoglycan/xylan/chitin deacetylase (PgdA/CDA1 family)
MQRRDLLMLVGAAMLCGARSPARASTGSDGERIVALTFDDGPHPALTPPLLDILQYERVPATFYVLGSCASRYPDIVRRAYDSGHEIGNHSWSHPCLTRIGLARAADELARTDELLRSINGAVPNTLRPPYGAMDRRVEALANPRPMILWDVDTYDWRSRYTPAVERAAMRGNGGIVLMHDIHSATVGAVPAVIRHFKAHGYRFATVSSYLTGYDRELPRTIDPAWAAAAAM